MSRRNEIRGRFAREVEGLAVKYQIGARGAKIGHDWLAIDRYDRSETIDHHYDIQNLPLDDSSVDCYVCNAILEHVPEPELAIYEMYRTLRPGGMIWVEVPFTQPFHAHPHDYSRVTVPGIRRWMKDFQEIAVGCVGNYERETRKYAGMLEAHIGSSWFSRDGVERIAELFERCKIDPDLFGKFYSYVYFWGRKPLAGGLSAAKKNYFEELKTQCHPDGLRPGIAVDFSAYGYPSAYLRSGWAAPERNGCWSVEPNPKLCFHILTPRAERFRIKMQGRSFPSEHSAGLSVEIAINGACLQIANLPRGQITFAAEVEFDESSLGAEGELEVAFQLSRTLSPAEVGVSGDRRRLGIRLEALQLLAL